MKFLLLLLLLVAAGQSWAQQPIDGKRVRIVRDSLGVPHIFAPTDAEAAYGLAWAHAEDNFRDIQYQLLAARGRLAEVLGKEGAIFDYSLQLFGIDTFARRYYERDLSPEFRRVAAGYAQALNDYAARYPKEILVPDVLPFREVDLVTGTTLIMTLFAGGGFALKGINDGIIDRLFLPNERGSNAVAVAPQRSEDGKTWLLSNSHQPIEGRFSWYEAHIQSDEGWNMTGGVFAGGLAIFVGTNPHLGWSHTTNYHNFGDVYELTINPKNKNQYRYNGEWRTFTKRYARLRVKVGKVKIRVRKKILETVWGPVFESKKLKKSYALRMPAATELRAMEQWFRMNKARNLAEFEQALKMNALSLFNIVYADKDGNIFFISDGIIPLRDSSLNWLNPIRSDSPKFLTQERLPYESKIKYLNPKAGFLYSCNNTPRQATAIAEDQKDAYHVGLQLFTYNRGDRYRRLFNAIQGNITWADLLRIKYDTRYDEDGRYTRNLRALLRLDKSKYPDIADCIERINAWDLSSDTSSHTAALMLHVHRQLLQDFAMPFAFYMIQNDTLTEAAAVSAVRAARKEMLRQYGTIDLPLGKIQRLERGGRSFAVSGLSEVSRAVDCKYDRKRGLFLMESGDGFIQFTRYSPDTTKQEIYSINAYGASSLPTSRHYTDQMQLFAQEKTRRVFLQRDSISARALYEYQPNDPNYDYKERSRR